MNGHCSSRNSLADLEPIPEPSGTGSFCPTFGAKCACPPSQRMVLGIGSYCSLGRTVMEYKFGKMAMQQFFNPAEKVSGTFFLLLRSAAGAEGRLQAESAHGAVAPGRVAKRTAPLDASSRIASNSASVNG